MDLLRGNIKTLYFKYLSVAFGSALILWLLASYGYDTSVGAAQNGEAIFGLRMLMSWLPAAGCALAALLVAVYPLGESRIREIVDAVHDAGGQVYMDGANMNAQVGLTNPGYIGADVCHLNLHKTFAMPHGGGGPGSGPVGCKKILASFLPAPVFGKKPEGYDESLSIGKVKCFYGNFLVALRAAVYIDTLGAEGIKDAAQKAVLNANYLMEGLKEFYPVAYDRVCMHEFVLTLENLKHEKGVSAMDVAKAMLDYGIHPPTMYFPLIVHEDLMFEPTETETKETLDEAIRVLGEIRQIAEKDAQSLHEAPHKTIIGRVDEVRAARQPVLKYAFND